VDLPLDNSSKEFEMTTQTKASTQPLLKIMSDILLVASGIIVGSLTAIIILWFWLDYQAYRSDSYLITLSTQLINLFPSSLREMLGGQAQIMGLPLSGETSAYWYMARAGGVTAYLLLWLSVMWGLFLSTKLNQSWLPAPIAYGLHEFLSILTLLFMSGHALVLLGDSYIDFNLWHLLFPFTAPYEPLWTGLGTLALYLAAVMTGSFYIRKKIGQRTWRLLHYLTFITYLLALGHGLMAGTDAPLLALKLLYSGTGLGVLFLLYYRLLMLKLR
jgi:hypothetical protein